MPYIWAPEPGYLSQAVVAELADRPARHPWLDLPHAYRMPGKAAHIAMLLRMHYSLDAYATRDGLAVIHPLVSQPIMECSLRIPTWRQCTGGYDRSIARRAFADALPSAVVLRRTKGSPQGFTYQIFEHYRPQIRDRLLDGHLMKNGILDREAVDGVFRSGRQVTGAEMMRLLMLVDTEAWVRHWSAKI